MSDTSKFLGALFQHALDAEAGKVLVATTKRPGRGMKSAFFDDLNAAEEYACGIDDQDVYVGMGIQPDGLKSNQRAKKTEVTGITSFYVDIDISGEGHADKKKYPPDQKTIEDILDKLPLKPSIIIHSGGGLQAFWLLNECWILDTEKERQEADSLSMRWARYVQWQFKQAGYGVDSVFDITRVMRCVGTFNHKYDPKRPVENIQCDASMQYSMDEFDQLLPAHEFSKTNKAALYKMEHVALQGDIAVPDCVADLAAKDSMFSRTWSKTRFDMDDDSASSYDLAIANAGVAHAWSDQDIAAAMIAFRRTHDMNPEKVVERMKYVSTTIGRARTDYAAYKMTTTVDMPEAGSGGPSDEQMAKYRLAVDTMMKIKVKRFIKHGKENAYYTIEFESPSVSVPIGDAMTVTNYRMFYCKCFDRGIALNVNKKEWDRICRYLLMISEEIEVEESSFGGETKRWVALYLGKQNVVKESKWQESLPGRRPFVREAKVWMHVDLLRTYIDRNCGTKLKSAELYDRLRHLNFEQKRMSANGTSVSVWGVPLGEVREWTAMVPKSAFEPEDEDEE